MQIFVIIWLSGFALSLLYDSLITKESLIEKMYNENSDLTRFIVTTTSINFLIFVSAFTHFLTWWCLPFRIYVEFLKK